LIRPVPSLLAGDTERGTPAISRPTSTTVSRKKASLAATLSAACGKSGIGPAEGSTFIVLIGRGVS